MFRSTHAGLVELPIDRTSLQDWSPQTLKSEVYPPYKPRFRPQPGQNPAIAGGKDPVMSPPQPKKPVIVEFTTQIVLSDYRPVLLIKSHSDHLSGPSSEVISAMAPEPLEVFEIPLLISQETTKGKALTPEEKFRAHVKDMGKDLKTRVYNALRWNLERYPELFTPDLRVVYIPHGNAIIAIGMVAMLEGLFGTPPEIGVMIPATGELVLNPEHPLMHLPEWKQSGRKLREEQPKSFRRKHGHTNGMTHEQLATAARDLMYNLEPEQPALAKAARSR